MTGIGRIGLVGRLRPLPAWFDVDMAAGLMGCTRGDALTYIHRWKKAQLIRPLSRERRYGVYFNLLNDTSSPQRCLFQALGHLVGGRLIRVGASALNAAGCTTQSPARPELAFMVSRGHASVPILDQAALLPRSPRWFGKLAAASTDAGYDNLMDAPPEMAIADALLAEHRNLGSAGERPLAWTGFGGDLDPDAVEENFGGIIACLESLGASADEIQILSARIAREDRRFSR